MKKLIEINAPSNGHSTQPTTHRSMGIKNLNQFIRRECSDAITTIGLNELHGKTVVVDASIFMYRFVADNALMENMYSMMSFFKMHNVTALFIFDGKPPEEKRKTLNKRRRTKHVAEMQYNRLLRDRDTHATPNAQDSRVQLHALKVLRRRFTRISDADFQRVWTLMRAMGVQYIVAEGEADMLCAQMVLKRKAYACVSDDTDLFVYGCSRVLRHINLFDQTGTLYDMHKILKVMQINMTEFRQICVISGTDYHSGSINLKIALQWFNQYRKCTREAEAREDVFAPDFYTWLHHTNDRFNYETATTVYKMFDISTTPMHLVPIVGHATRDETLLREIMSHENFIFAC
jgi:5'-3' exonuclease